MGLITGAASLISVAGTVASGVMTMGAKAISLGAGIIKHPIGKIAIGAGAAALLVSKYDDNNEDSLLGKAKAGIMGLVDSFKNMIGVGVSATAAKAAVAVDNFSAAGMRESLEDLVAGDTAQFENAIALPEQGVLPVAVTMAEQNEHEAAAENQYDMEVT